MAEGVTATFGVDDEVTVLQKTDRDGGGDGVVTAVIGTGVDTRYTVRYTGRHKSTKPVTVSGDQLQHCPALGKRKRGAAAAAHADGSPRCPLPAAHRMFSAQEAAAPRCTRRLTSLGRPPAVPPPVRVRPHAHARSSPPLLRAGGGGAGVHAAAGSPRRRVLLRRVLHAGSPASRWEAASGRRWRRSV